MNYGPFALSIRFICNVMEWKHEMDRIKEQIGRTLLSSNSLLTSFLPLTSLHYKWVKNEWMKRACTSLTSLPSFIPSLFIYNVMWEKEWKCKKRNKPLLISLPFHFTSFRFIKIQMKCNGMEWVRDFNGMEQRSEVKGMKDEWEEKKRKREMRALILHLPFPLSFRFFSLFSFIPLFFFFFLLI